jgi:hypothetical protein
MPPFLFTTMENDLLFSSPLGVVSGGGYLVFEKSA